jgi:hypothetical protein
MRFYGGTKHSFADSGGVYFVARFVNGIYETDDKEEIRLLKQAGYKNDETGKGKKKNVGKSD